MIFSTNKAAEIEKKDSAFLGAGIHENVSYVGTKTDRTMSGNTFIEFEFIKGGEKLSHTEWKPTKFNDQTDADFEAKALKQVSRILQIMSAFIPKEKLQGFEADTFEAFASWVVSMMTSADTSTPVRLKVIYGKNGFTSLPQYAAYTFIESMNVPKEQSKIKELKIDTFTRPEIGDREVDTQTASAVFANSSVSIPQNGSAGYSYPQSTSAPF